MLYRLGNVISCAYKIICTHTSRYLFAYVITLLDTYIHCGHIWHRNNLSRCQTELLVSCSNDEHQTSLKWDRSNHPVAPECRISHTVRLKHFTVSVRCPSELCSCTFNVTAVGKLGLLSDTDDLKISPRL